MPKDSDHPERDYLTRDDAKVIVRETLVAIGFDVDDPIESQADARFVRSMRKTHEKVGAKIVVSMVGLVVSGTVILVVMGIASWVNTKAGV